MTPDVITNLYGGFGNQLFQYAATLHTMKALGLSSYELLFLEGHRDGPDIGSFLDVQMRHPSRADRAKWTEFAEGRSPLNPVFRRTSRFHERRTARMLIKQSSPFDGVPDLGHSTHVKLEGFFQNPEWYADTWRDVADELALRAPQGFTDLADEGRVVIHFRRGDYVRSHWDMPPSYYISAVNGMDLRGREVVIIGDESGFVPWMAQVLQPLGCGVVPARTLTGNAVVDDFWNVAAGGTIVLANSTFSWWAAAVATRRESQTRVAYPRPWIVNRWAPEEVSNLGLSGWLPFDSGLPPHSF